MGPAETEMAAEVESWLAQAADADAAEDAALGIDRRGDEMPTRTRDEQRRLERIQAAGCRGCQAGRGDKADGSPRGRRKPKHPPGVPKRTAQHGIVRSFG